MVMTIMNRESEKEIQEANEKIKKLRNDEMNMKREMDEQKLAAE